MSDHPPTAETDAPESGDAGAGEKAEFPLPPRSFTDDEGREIEIRTFDGEVDALIEMYDRVEPEDRTQGIPPRTEAGRISWIETLTGEGLNLVAWHRDEAVGHAVLMPMDDGRWELAIFVRSDYQQAHIGSNLLRCLLGYGREHGVETVWLSVERYNDVALALYESLGFEKLSGVSEYKMERDI